MRLKFPSKKYIKIVIKALTPEIRRITTRSKVSLENEGILLILKVKAVDTVALRATLNAYLRWISAIYSIFSTLDLFYSS